MNERIKELIKQSYDEMNEPNSDPIAREWLMKDLLPEYQRFAELIVKECITHIGKDQFRKADQLDTEYDEGYVDGMSRAVRVLKEHFEIE